MPQKITKTVNMLLRRQTLKRIDVSCLLLCGSDVRGPSLVRYPSEVDQEPVCVAQLLHGALEVSNLFRGPFVDAHRQ